MTAVTTRAERLAQIRSLQTEGLSTKHIAMRLGIAANTVRSILNDPDGSKNRERKKRYRGVCVDCGGWTDGGSGRARAPQRCRYCTQGVPRPTPPDSRRRVPVRLPEIPLDRRMAAAEEACRFEKGEMERLEIVMAAVSPSDATHWVAA